MKRNATALTRYYHVIKKDGVYKVKSSLLANIDGSLFCSSSKSGAEKHISLLIQSIAPSPLPETKTGVSIDTPKQPYYKGRGEHSVKQLEAICQQYKEYVSFLNSKTATPPTPGNERPTGEGLPETIDVHSTGLLEFEAQLYSTNDPHGLKVLADVNTLEFAEELAKRYNSYPAMYRALGCFVEAVDIIVEAEGSVTESRRQVYVSIQNSNTYKQAKAILNNINNQ